MKSHVKAAVRVANLHKSFVLTERNSEAVSLMGALRAGQNETRSRTIHALDGVTFTVEEGERVGIVGSNGAGKTTLLSIIAGITEASHGSIEVDGNVHAMLTIGAVLREEATGRENIYLDGAVHGMNRAEIEAHIEDIIAFAELNEFIDRPVRTYSSGMKARLAFSMVTSIEPDVLIIDETLAVGDVFFATKALRRLKELTAKGRIVLLVSHALSSIVEMCERCIWLDEGRILMDGPSHDVVKAYEKSVRQADEADLMAKFARSSPLTPRPETGTIESVTLEQDGQLVKAAMRALQPFKVSLEGRIGAAAQVPDLTVSIDRVDGRQIYTQTASGAGLLLPSEGAFRIELDFNPPVLGAGLYRFEVILTDELGAAGSAVRVFEIVDETGQFGGVPMLYYPPSLAVQRTGNLSS